MPKRKQKEQYYSISKIVAHRERGSEVEYKVHWAGYPSSQDTWEPESNLVDCQEFIQEYIMSSVKGRTRQPRRSARLANLEPAPMVFSEEEEEFIRTPVVKKPRKTKTPSQPKPKAAKPKPDTPAVLRLMTSQDPTPSYSLRVMRQPVPSSSASSSYSLRSMRRVDLSSDEEDFSGVQRVKKVRISPKLPTARMGLSETRFHSQIDKQIDKRKYASSTPVSVGSTVRPTRSSKRLANNTLEVTTTTITRKPPAAKEPEDDTISGGTATTEEEEEEEVVTIVTTKNLSTGERATWHDIGWKEVALAGFLAGVGVLGYICYVSDLCSYC